MCSGGGASDGNLPEAAASAGHSHRRQPAHDGPLEGIFCHPESITETAAGNSVKVRVLLQGKTDPEVKRKIIGGGFIDVFRDFATTLKSKHGVKPKFLVQVTLCILAALFLDA